MHTSTVEIRVRYAETDQMGFVYYGNYATYFEVARVEALRSLGLSYKEMEVQGVMLPVVDFSIKYHAPATYDDLILVKTTIKTMPTSKIHFTYECLHGDKVLTTAETTLVFVNKST
ncbi:MAG: acyl-CoA thioester hydrolase, partial [Flavobacteriales bacterium]